jgi:type IV pilus assembly protein PilC
MLIKFLKLIVEAIYNVLKFFFYGLKAIILYIAKGLYKVFKVLAILIKSLFKYIYIIIKSFITGLYVIIRSVYRVIALIIRSFVTGVYLIFNKVILFIFRIIKKFTIGVWHVISTIFNGIVKFFGKIISSISYLFHNFGSIIKGSINKLNNFIKNKINGIKNYFIGRYNNLDFVKYLKNKRDFQRKVLLIDFMDEDNIERSEQKQTYQYIARSSEGKIITGYFDAFSKVDVHSFLLAEGAEVYSIKTSKWIQFLASLRHNKHYTIKYKDLAFLLTQLSTYIKAGIPLVDALKILSRQERNVTKKSIYDSVIYEVVMGASLSEAFEKQGPAFPKLLINMIKTSEMTGKISEVLDNMAEYYDSAQKTRSQMLSAMLYPAMVFVMATGVIVFVMLYIIPQFVEMFRNMDTELPAITRIVINVSDFLKADIVYVLLGVAAVIFIFRFLYSTVKAFRYVIQWIMMHLPVLGKIIIYNEVTMFAKTFGSLLTHNVFITDSMEILSKITNNEIYKLLIFDTISNLGRGDEISSAFKNHWAFPRIAYEMLRTGEKTGEVGIMMNKVGDYYQEQHKLSIGQIKSFIEPVMIIFLAATVGTILLSIIVPMFSMYQQF